MLAKQANPTSMACGNITLPNGMKAKVCAFHNLEGANDDDHILLVDGDFQDKPPLVRIHSSCITGDLYHAAQCDCGSQLEEAIKRISEEGGAVVYLHQEGRNIGLYNKMRAYQLKEQGLDTYEANRALGFPNDARKYDAAVKMLKLIGFHRIRFLTNNPEKVRSLKNGGIDVTEVIPTGIHHTCENEAYLHSKQTTGGHMFVSS